MSVQDLNQRYGNTWVKYGDDYLNIREFTLVQNKVVIVTSVDNGIKFTPFQWDKLDVARPPARWLEVKGAPLYFSYNNARQWQRGFQRNTVDVFNFGARWTWADVIKEIYTQPRRQRQPVSVDEIIKVISTKGGWKILSDTMCVGGGAYIPPGIYRRSKKLASVDITNKHNPIQIIDPYYDADINEVVRV